MGGVFSHGTSVTILRHRIRALARQLEVRMLIIDEIHSLLAGTFREQRVILNAIRFLANASDRSLSLSMTCFLLSKLRPAPRHTLVKPRSHLRIELL